MANGLLVARYEKKKGCTIGADNHQEWQDSYEGCNPSLLGWTFIYNHSLCGWKVIILIPTRDGYFVL